MWKSTARPPKQVQRMASLCMRLRCKQQEEGWRQWRSVKYKTPGLGYDRSEEIAVMRAMDFDVEDNNEPAPENILSPDELPEATERIYSECKGSSGV